MKLVALMQRGVEVVSGDASVRDAARIMAERDVGALPVQVDGAIAGMVTDRDLVIRSLAQGDDPDLIRVSEVMTHDTAWCYLDESIDHASRIMGEHQIQRLLVRDHGDNLVGIVSIGDMARARGNSPTATRTLEEIKGPTKSTALGASVEAQR
jgi:IMP dehydrogenase